MTRMILSKQLTTCDVAADGSVVRLDFVDAAGAPVSVVFPFAQAQSIVMTLPGLLAESLRRQTGSEDARFVFGLGHWSMEGVDDQCVILTLSTEEGFSVSFGIPFEACKSLGWALRNPSTEAIGGEPGRPPDIH